MLRWLAILLLLGFTAAAASDHTEPPNYCQSPESWAEWQELLAKRPSTNICVILRIITRNVLTRAKAMSSYFHQGKCCPTRTHRSSAF